jgi:NAD(P)-dependent dehydrogenase (short-subunit alcohol dehydrogenase family)/acyl dehydratase
MTDLPALGTRRELMVDMTEALIERFAALTGDRNPIHFDDSFARARGLPGRVVHGMAYASFLSTLVGMHLPGPGALWASQTMRFLKPVRPGDQVVLTGVVAQRSERTGRLVIEITGVNQDGVAVFTGEAEVLVPTTAPATRTNKPKSHVGPRAAYVFGASGTLGRTIATRLARTGHPVGLVGRRLDALERLEAELDGPSMPVRCDLVDATSVEAAVSQLTARLGPPAIVVHCASAPLCRQGVEEIGWAELAPHFAVQACGLANLVRHCQGSMRAAGGGVFIYIGSIAAHGAPPAKLAAYAAAKAAGASMLRSMALELAPFGIRANIVSPSFLATDLTAHIDERTRKLAAAQTPMRRLAALDEIAAAVAFLAGADGSFVNGHDLVVDGGMAMR